MYLKVMDVIFLKLFFFSEKYLAQICEKEQIPQDKQLLKLAQPAAHTDKAGPVQEH